MPSDEDRGVPEPSQGLERGYHVFLQDIPKSEFLSAASGLEGRLCHGEALLQRAGGQSKSQEERGLALVPRFPPVQTPGHSFIHSSPIINTILGQARWVSRKSRQGPRDFYAVRERDKQ